MTLTARREWWPFVAVGVLAALCGSLAILQYRWIDEVSGAERERLQKDLTARLEDFRQAFGERIDGQRRILTPLPDEIESEGRDAAWSNRLRRWRQTGLPIFSRVALAVPEGGDVVLLLPDASDNFTRAPWPEEWAGEYRRLALGPGGRGFGPPEEEGVAGLIEFPDFGRDEHGPDHPRGRGAFREQSWLLAELNLSYIRTSLAPELTARFLADGDYDTAIRDGGGFLYESAASVGKTVAESPDASVALEAFNPGPEPPMRGRGRGGPPARTRRDAPWTLLARHRAGSLEAIVERARRRNIAASTGMLLLIVAIVAMLVRLSRQKERLALMQMNFVTGVSHELRTPLTVIRTAAFNLRGRISKSPEQVERYGKLIEEQSLTLTDLVDRVLLFARSGAGRISGDRARVRVEDLIEEALKASLGDSPVCAVERSIESGLPEVSVDAGAMTQALRNLIDNAVKYSGEGAWIGIRAVSCGGQVEITVADRGPGIPDDERPEIFNAFFRGRRAIADQIHGTGLGLHLTRSIVTANGGSVSVRSGVQAGSEFTITLPVAVYVTAAQEAPQPQETKHAAYSAD